jgi:hypothetical protein
MLKNFLFAVERHDFWVIFRPPKRGVFGTESKQEKRLLLLMMLHKCLKNIYVVALITTQHAVMKTS